MSTFLRERREAELCPDQKLLRQAETPAGAELKIYRQADALITVTKNGQALRRELPESRIFVVPNIHDLATDAPPATAAKACFSSAISATGQTRMGCSYFIATSGRACCSVCRARVDHRGNHPRPPCRRSPAPRLSHRLRPQPRALFALASGLRCAATLRRRHERQRSAKPSPTACRSSPPPSGPKAWA